MSTETPIPGGPAALQRAEIEGLVAARPLPAVLLSGFLAGFLISWLPFLVLIFTQLYGTFFSGESYLPFEQRWANALAENGRLGSRLLGIILPGSLAVAAYGGLLAWLRRTSALADRYLVMPTQQGDVRWGLDMLLSLFGIPLGVLAFVVLSGRGQAILFSLFLIVLSGFAFYLLWRRFDDLFLRLLTRPAPETVRAGGLHVLLTTVFGRKRCLVAAVEIPPGEREVVVRAEVADPETESEIRDLVRQYVRGVQIIKIERPQ